MAKVFPMGTSTVYGIMELITGGTMTPKQGQTYRHFKGGVYDIVSVTNDNVKYRQRKAPA